MRCCGCFRGHSDKFDPLIFLLQEMARVHYAKMGPKMQSIKSEPGESHVAQPRLLQVLHGLKKNFNEPSRQTHTGDAGWCLEHPVDIGISVSVRPRFIGLA